MASKNKHIRVVNENGTSTMLSSAIIIDYLKEYTSDWGDLSTSAALQEIEELFPEVLDPAVSRFNNKIGYTVPRQSLNSIIDEVVNILKKESPDNLLTFQSFNNLEKVAVFFILRVENPGDKSISEIFDIINNNYDDLSKRDIMIRLLSENEVEGTIESSVDPINGLYKLIHTAPFHSADNEILTKFDKLFGSGDIKFKEFTFPMHSYNTTKRLTELNSIGSNEDVRDYYDVFNRTWKANTYVNNDSKVIINSEWNTRQIINTNAVSHWETVMKDSIMDTIKENMKKQNVLIASFPGYLERPFDSIKNYKDVLNISNTYTPFGKSDEPILFKYLGDNFLDQVANEKIKENASSFAPLTMTEHAVSSSVTSPHFNRYSLNAGWLGYDFEFNRFKTLLSYYNSDINFWLTGDKSTTNTAFSDYKYVQSNTGGMLPSSSKSETKGYFSNIMFIQSAIQRILYPKILNNAYIDTKYTTDRDWDMFFRTNTKTYDTIFDSIVNNAFVYTDKDLSPLEYTHFEDNYEIIPNRLTLDSIHDKEEVRLTTNYKATNLYEFIINNLVNSKNNVIGINGSGRRILNGYDVEKFTKADKIYEGDISNYNKISEKVVHTSNSITVSDFNSEEPNSIVYNFGETYNPLNTEWIRHVTDAFFKPDYKNQKVNYRKLKFFKLPVHDEELSLELNRNITRVDRELLTDISDIANFNIEGLSLADFTYGEKALLTEYMSNYRSVKGLTQETDVELLKHMIKEINYLREWKISPVAAKASDPNNSYYKITRDANPIRNSEELNNFQQLQKTIYFPEMLTVADINSIRELLARALFKVNKNRNGSINPRFMPGAKELLKHSALKINYSVMNDDTCLDTPMTLETIGSNFLNSFKWIISDIKDTSEYRSALLTFRAAHNTGQWDEVLLTLYGLKSVLLDNTLISRAITNNGLYTGDKNTMLKNLDIGLYKLFIINYFGYISNANEEAVANIHTKVFVDNHNTGMIRYYSDIVNLLRFSLQYHELVPKYVKYLEDNVLKKYYSKIEAIKSLPTWDYESFHRRDQESSLKESAGINVKDYNIVWSANKENMVIIYKGNKGNHTSYRISDPIYYGGLSNSDNEYDARTRWWKKWLNEYGDTFRFSELETFKVPLVEITDNNIYIPKKDMTTGDEPRVWSYDLPTESGKLSLFSQLSNRTGQSYTPGKVANMTSFKYATNGLNNIMDRSYINIGVPLLLLGDDGKEWNKPNTTRKNSFSFETEFLNLWHTDEKYTDGGDRYMFNNGGGEAYTTSYKLVSGSDHYRKFGIGNMDIQNMFRHLWTMESSPMGNPYTVMNYDMFTPWDMGYEAKKGDFPWSTERSTYNSWMNLDWYLSGGTEATLKIPNKYQFKFVLDKHFRQDSWAPVVLSGWDKTVGVNKHITNDEIYDNFYLTTTKGFKNMIHLESALLDIYNRNFRNRIYLSFLKWRYYINRKEV